jgi:hypothetical protein
MTSAPTERRHPVVIAPASPSNRAGCRIALRYDKASRLHVTNGGLDLGMLELQLPNARVRHGAHQSHSRVGMAQAIVLLARHDDDRVASAHVTRRGLACRARRTTSLNRALASCKRQGPPFASSLHAALMLAHLVSLTSWADTACQVSEGQVVTLDPRPLAQHSSGTQPPKPCRRRWNSAYAGAGQKRWSAGLRSSMSGLNSRRTLSGTARRESRMG